MIREFAAGLSFARRAGREFQMKKCPFIEGVMTAKSNLVKQFRSVTAERGDRGQFSKSAIGITAAKMIH